jgi:hypothetical protein
VGYNATTIAHLHLLALLRTKKVPLGRKDERGELNTRECKILTVFVFGEDWLQRIFRRGKFH